MRTVSMVYRPLVILLHLMIVPCCLTAQTAPAVLLHEPCEQPDFAARGWYDNTGLQLTSTESLPGGTSALEFRFAQGASTPTSGGAARYLFPPAATVYLSYWVKYSANWEGSNRPYHPHEFHFISTADHKWIGPAATHLTTYVEQNEGRPLLAIQDALNIDETNIGVDLTGVTERRAVAGCNGSGDAYPAGDCYRAGSTHRNGKVWAAAEIMFSDEAGERHKNLWHFVEALFQLNSIVDGVGIPDGLLNMWVDGELVVDAPGVLLRTGQHPDMAFNQFLVAPYIGDGSPVDQRMWVDEILIATGRRALLAEPVLVSPPHRSRASAAMVDFVWNPVPGAMWYTLETAEDSLFVAGAREVSQIPSPSITLPAPSEQQALWWRVRAENPAGAGPWSAAQVLLPDNTSGVTIGTAPTSVLIEVHPHPVHHSATITLRLGSPRTVSVELYDVLGRKRLDVFHGHMPSGSIALPFTTRHCSAGVYLLRVTSREGTTTHPIVLR